jgi:hypothetical protein
MRYQRSFLVMTSSRYARKLTYTLDLTCQCTAVRTKTHFRLKALYYIIEEILLTTSFNINYEVTFLKRSVFLCKLVLKRPSLLINILFFIKIFQLSNGGGCKQHSLTISDESIVWYATSAAKLGFPWPHDSFLNSLKFIRDRDIEIFVFGLKTHSLDSNVPVDTLLVASQNTKIRVDDIYSWKTTKLQIVTNAEITHGTILSKNSEMLMQDLDLTYHLIPKRMNPSSIWFKEFNSEGMVLNTPKHDIDVFNINSCIFINSLTDNFYHFLSESIRVLILAHDAKIKVDNLVIRSGLPNQFYEIVTEICPNTPIIKLDRGQCIKAKKIFYATLAGRVSSESSFTSKGLEFFQNADEWKTWSWLRNRFLIHRDARLCLYLPREKHESRGILNSNFLGKKLLSSNFQFLDTQSASFMDQRNKFGSAKIACSASGASLLNMIFMPKGTMVLEITYPNLGNWEFLAALCEINYVCVPMKSLLPQNLNVSLDVYLAPVGRIMEKIEKLGN